MDKGSISCLSCYYYLYCCCRKLQACIWEHFLFHYDFKNQGSAFYITTSFDICYSFWYITNHSKIEWLKTSFIELMIVDVGNLGWVELGNSFVISWLPLEPVVNSGLVSRSFLELASYGLGGPQFFFMWYLFFKKLRLFFMVVAEVWEGAETIKSLLRLYLEWVVTCVAFCWPKEVTRPAYSVG